MIRTVARRDTPAIVEIAEAVRINPHNPDPRLIDKGFLVYVLSEDDYVKRENTYFTLSSDGEGVAGFLMCYSGEFLRELVADGSISHQDGAVDFLLREGGGPFLFGDQIAVSPTASRRGIGRELMHDMFGRMRDAGFYRMYVTILHRPVINVASIQFCEGLGARCVQVVTNKDGLTWGVYLFEPELPRAT